MNFFSKLASETTGEIFNHCLPPESEPISSKNSPLLLIQVCRRWRNVAFSTPVLWQIIHMDREWKRKPIFILDLFLNKSRNLPLTITLPFSTEKAAKQKEAFANRLLDDFHRVLSLKGHAPPLLLHFLFNRLSAPGTPSRIYAPLLKYLNVSCFNISGNLPQKEVQKFLRNYIFAPNVEEFHVHGNRMTLSMVNFSPEALKVFTGLHVLDGTALSDMILLSRAVELVTLDLHFYNAYEDTTPGFLSSICLPKLKHLNIYSYGTQYTELIRALHSPAIEKLGLHLRADALLPEFVEVLTKGHPSPLRSLLLWNCPDTQLSILYGFREVEELTLCTFELDETSTQALMEKDGSEFRLFPRLSSFILEEVALSDTKVSDLLFAVLRARSVTNGGTLAYAKFEYYPGEKNDLRAFQIEMRGKMTIDVITLDDDDGFPEFL